jgi:hypothetical protein
MAIQKIQTSEQSLISLLKTENIGDLLRKDDATIKTLVYEISYGLTIEKAMQAPKIFQLKKKIGESNLLKLLAVIIKSFCDSVKASKTMDAVDILECSELVMEKYTHESVKDIVLALKDAKLKGMSFYNVINTPVVFQIIEEGLNKKYAFIEKRESDNKAKFTGSTNEEIHTLVIQNEREFERKEKEKENKQVKIIQQEKKEVNRLKDFVTKMIDKL